MMCLLGAFLLAPATRLQQNYIDRTEANGPINLEEEMRSLVSTATEGLGYKQSEPEVRKRRSSNSDTASVSSSTEPSAAGASVSTSSGAGASAGSSADGAVNATGAHGVQRFGTMHVVT